MRICPRFSPSVATPTLKHRVRLWLFLTAASFLPRMMWAAGAVAAMSSITFPAISAMVSRNTDPDQQGECLGTHLMGGGSTQQVLGWAGTSVPAVECLCTHRVLTPTLSMAGALQGNSQVMQVGVWWCLSEAEEAAAFCLPHSTSPSPQLNSSSLLLDVPMLISVCKAASPALLIFVEPGTEGSCSSANPSPCTSA